MIRAAPRGGREAMPHWLAAKAGRLSMPFCVDCGRMAWPPGAGCPHCRGALEWRDCSGRGRIASFSIVHRAVQPEWDGAEPYVVAFVALEEAGAFGQGGRLLTNIVGCDPSTVRCGQPVLAEFVPTADPDLGLVVFRIVASDPSGDPAD